MKNLVQTYTDTFKLAKNLKATFTIQAAGGALMGFEVEWSPDIPTSPIGRTVWKKYKAARECFAKDVAKKSGHPIHIVTQDEGGGDWRTIIVRGDA
jgi:hypothetical protein